MCNSHEDASNHSNTTPSLFIVTGLPTIVNKPLGTFLRKIRNCKYSNYNGK
jgi:hypothetical protein